MVSHCSWQKDEASWPGLQGRTWPAPLYPARIVLGPIHVHRPQPLPYGSSAIRPTILWSLLLATPLPPEDFGMCSSLFLECPSLLISWLSVIVWLLSKPASIPAWVSDLSLLISLYVPGVFAMVRPQKFLC